MKVSIKRIGWLLAVTVMFLGTLCGVLEHQEAKKKELNIPKVTVKLEKLHTLPHIDVIIDDHVLKNYDHFVQQMDMNGKTSPDYINSSYYGHGMPELNVFIDSGGGSFDVGYGIQKYFNKLRMMYGFTINCWVVRANSMAFSVLQQCDNRKMFKGGYLGIHNVKGSTKYSNFVSDLQRAVYEIQKTNLNRRQLVEMRMVDKDTPLYGDVKYYSAEEALNLNFIDEVL